MPHSNYLLQFFMFENLNNVRAYLREGIFLHVGGLGRVPVPEKIGAHYAIAGVDKADGELVPDDGVAGKAMKQEKCWTVSISMLVPVGVCVAGGESKLFVAGEGGHDE